jgi:hypothetical protein
MKDDPEEVIDDDGNIVEVKQSRKVPFYSEDDEELC